MRNHGPLSEITRIVGSHRANMDLTAWMVHCEFVLFMGIISPHFEYASMHIVKHTTLKLTCIVAMYTCFRLVWPYTDLGNHEFGIDIKVHTLRFLTVVLISFNVHL